MNDQPGPDEYDGQGPNLHAAAEKAWEKAKNAKKDPGWYEVKKIWVRTENPIGEYKVRIKG